MILILSNIPRVVKVAPTCHHKVSFKVRKLEKYTLLLQSPRVYSYVIERLGAFYAIVSYLGALGKNLIVGTVFVEIVIDSGVCASG